MLVSVFRELTRIARCDILEAGPDPMDERAAGTDVEIGGSEPPFATEYHDLEQT